MLILGSSSKGRLDILNKLGIKPDLILSPDIDEAPLKKEMPKMLSLRLAKAKGLKLSQDYPNDIIINLFTEPLDSEEIINLFPEHKEKVGYLDNRINYDFKTKYSSTGYIKTKEIILTEIKNLINEIVN